MSYESTGFPSIDSFSDEFTKIALSSGDEMPPAEYQAERKGRMKRMVGDALLGAAGFGLGYGAGSAAGRLTVAGKPTLFKHKYAPMVMGAAGLGLGLMHRAANRKRQEYVEQSVNKA